MPERAARFAEVDLIKAVGILTVVLIHVIRSPFEGGASWAELWIGQWTRFAVPGFLAASGFLYATSQPVSWATTRTRLWRIAAPYLVFSVVAQLLRHMQGRELWGMGSGSVWLDFAFAASLGPYYYVFIAAVLVAATPLFARLGRRTSLALLCGELVAQGFFELSSNLSFFWHLRNPFLWLAWFHLGWWARIHHDSLIALAARRRTAVVSALVLAVLLGIGLLGLDLSQTGRRLVQWLAIFPILGALLVASCGRSLPPIVAAPIVRLSEATYTIYLIHLFALIPLRHAWRAAPGHFEPGTIIATWAIAVVASLAGVALGRAVLGRHSRTWIGS